MISRLFISCLCILSLTGCHSNKNESKKVAVRALRVEPTTVPADFQFVGVAKSSHPVEIRARVEGYLQSIDYTEGELVQAGKLLFRLDPSQFDARLIEAKGVLAAQEANLWRAKRSLARLEPLYEKNAASQKDRDDALSQVLSGQAEVITANANVIQAQLNLGYTYITSPITGYTDRARYREGTLITPSVNGLLTEVSIIDPIWVVFSVSDSELLQATAQGKRKNLILPDEKVYRVTLQLSDGSLFPQVGSVNFASPTLDQQTGALVVRAEFANPNGDLLPGQFVSATVKGAKWNNVLLVPKEAVSQGREGMYLFVVNSDRVAERRNVQVGQWVENDWIIEQGLQAGDFVVVEGSNKVENGTEVDLEIFSQ